MAGSNGTRRISHSEPLDEEQAAHLQRLSKVTNSFHLAPVLCRKLLVHHEMVVHCMMNKRLIVNGILY